MDGASNARMLRFDELNGCLALHRRPHRELHSILPARAAIEGRAPSALPLLLLLQLGVRTSQW